MSSRRLAISVSLILAFSACVKMTIPIAPPPPKAPPATGDTTTTAPIPYVKGSWQCQIDGVNYSGTIDSSFTHYDSSHDPSHPDTVIFCTGTTADKSANLHFQIDFNRYPVRNIPYFTTATNGAQFDFDTCSNNILEAFYGSQSEVDFYIDSAYKDSLKAHFSGTLSLVNANGVVPGHTISNGTFTAGWRGGDHDANSFVYTPSSNLATKFDGYDNGVVGYFNGASMVSNTLVLSGTPYNWSGQSTFQLLVRTGGTIKPGTYHSENGDASLVLYAPSINRNYVDDSTGSLTVTISNVSGNTVYGNFSGTNQDGSAISGGSFAVRIKGYVPEADSMNKWGCGTFLPSSPAEAYNIYGGNVLNAAMTNSSGRYSLTINGASDHGASVFKLVISSSGPIQTGSYVAPGYVYSSNTVDSLFFTSPQIIWNGLNANYTLNSYPPPTVVIVDSIGAHYVQGEIKGGLNLMNPSGNLYLFNPQQGRFSASY